MKVSGHIIDIDNKRIYKGEIVTDKGIIQSIIEKQEVDDQYLLPGFIDAHVHIESSMLVPSEFARMAVVHGTVATISDPHEIGNVLGVDGVQYMIDNGNKVPFKFYFGAPSCVPATPFETAGAEIDVDAIENLLQKKEIKYLAEMMNWPGVLNQDATVMAKIAIANKYNKVIDGHAPGLKGAEAKSYIHAGISTDHECFTEEEARDKLKHGMKILIREGSAAKNFNALINLLHEFPDYIMFCSDDKHPDSLEEGHINLLVKRALAHGIDIFNVLKAACINPIDHYKLEVGKLRTGEHADFIIINNLTDFTIKQTYINGNCVAAHGTTKINAVQNEIINHFLTTTISTDDIKLKAKSNTLRVIEALDGQLITNEIIFNHHQPGPYITSDLSEDILKIVVVNRYNNASPPAIAFIKNIGLKSGAIASSVGHDSHNIIAVGADDESIIRAINLIIKNKGGVSAINGAEEAIIPLPVAGIMSANDGYEIAKQYKAIDAMAKRMGSKLGSPFMTLSFMGLLVIPNLKLSDKGLFDGNQFEFKEVFC